MSCEGMSVLVIDDEEGMREGMRRVLKKKGFTVDTAENGADAIDKMKKSAYDLALVDLKMPGIDGFQVTGFIKEHFGDGTVVVIVSALATVEAAVEVTSRGAFDFLVKPFTPADLLQVVERAVNQRRLIQERETYLTELNSERNLSRQIINSMREGVVVVNLNRRPVLMNPRAEFFLGTRFSEGMSLEEAGFSDQVLEVMERLFSDEKDGGQVVLREKHQDQMLEVQLTPHLRDGARVGVIINMRDVTEEWKAEQDKNRFISMVAHELTSPLAAIINYINIILTGMFDEKPDKIHEMLGRSKVRGEALLDLIKDLQYLNKREAGKVEKSMEPLDLSAVIADQLEFMKGQAERNRITCLLEKNEDDFTVHADRGDLDRIFMNLISNGIKYNVEGGTLTVGLTRNKKDILIRVSDTGIGMSEKEMANLFQEFYRVKNPKTSGISGTGLGLATIKRVLDGYNGRIYVESEPGKGTTFTVRFPGVSSPV
ncbi:MAG: response regulator [Spirochaetales bacterium]|nr:response regulator [Spirochaetales bacterium]